jgi:multidrug resistance efflux pump
MAWWRKARPALYVTGFALAVGCLLGARALTVGTSEDKGQKTINRTSPGKLTGIVVLGTVDSDPPPIQYGLPSILQSGTVIRVSVTDGQLVKAGDELYAFDDSIQRGDLEQAKVAVEMARNKVKEAEEARTQHKNKIEILTLTKDAAIQKENTAAKLYHLIEENLKTNFINEKVPEVKWAERLSKNPDLFKANADYADALNVRKRLESELAILQATNVQLLVDQAEIGVKQAKAAEAKAQNAVDLCVVRAKTAGVIEQITISPGSTLGISTRTPAMWLIPSEKRVVRAEIEADFAHRIGNNLEGKEVTICDHTDPKLTYKGTVIRVGSTFLPKRSATEGLLGNDTRVLEATIEVTALPPGDPRPPLRVGQRVRVNFGQ